MEANDLDSVARVAGTFVDGWKYEAQGQILWVMLCSQISICLSFFLFFRSGRKAERRGSLAGGGSP